MALSPPLPLLRRELTDDRVTQPADVPCYTSLSVLVFFSRFLEGFDMCWLPLAAFFLPVASVALDTGGALEKNDVNCLISFFDDK